MPTTSDGVPAAHAGPQGPAGERVFVGLGANLGDAAATVLLAAARLNALPQTRLLRCSSLVASSPVDAQGPDFVNAVAEVRTTLTPHALLKALQALENDFGRQRPHRNAPRTLDLDLLLVGHQTLQSAELTLPHPRLHLRRFVLQPLAEIAPGLLLPGRGPVEAELAKVADQGVAPWPGEYTPEQ